MKVDDSTQPARVQSTRQVDVAQNASTSLSPGSYANVVVHPLGQLILSAGSYDFNSLDLEPTAHISASGPVEVALRGSSILRGTFDMDASTAQSFALNYSATTALIVETVFRGTLAAPQADVTLRPITGHLHEREIVARVVHLDAGATIVHRTAACH